MFNVTGREYHILDNVNAFNILIYIFHIIIMNFRFDNCAMQLSTRCAYLYGDALLLPQ